MAQNCTFYRNLRQTRILRETSGTYQHNCLRCLRNQWTICSKSSIICESSEVLAIPFQHDIDTPLYHSVNSFKKLLCQEQMINNSFIIVLQVHRYYHPKLISSCPSFLVRNLLYISHLSLSTYSYPSLDNQPNFPKFCSIENSNQRMVYKL